MAGREIVPYGVHEPISLSIIPPQGVAPVPSNQSYFAQAIRRLVLAPPPPRLLLKDNPRQADALPMIKVPKVINLLPPKANEMLTGVKTNKFGDLMRTCQLIICWNMKSIHRPIQVNLIIVHLYKSAPRNNRHR